MRLRWVFLIALLAAAAVAGCQGSEAPAPDSGSTPPAAAATQSPQQSQSGAPASVADAAAAASTPATQTGSTQAETATPVAIQSATAGPMSGAEGESAYEDLLSWIPDSPEARIEVFINDYALARRLFDIPLPGPGDEDEALEEFYDWMPPLGYDPEYPTPVFEFGATSFFGPINHLQYLRDNLQHLAFDARNLDQSISAGVPPGGIDLEQGRFDPQAAERALEACSECSPFTREEHKGVTYYAWGEDGLIQEPDMQWAPPAFDRLGRGGRIAVFEEYLVRANTSVEIRSIIDAMLNETSSLANVEEFRLLAAAMSELGAYVMMLSDDVEAHTVDGLARQSLGDSAPQSDLDAFKEKIGEAVGDEFLRSYVAYATGAGLDEGGAYTALALVHADPAIAEENVERLRMSIETGMSLYYGQPWTDSIDVGASEFSSKGRVLLAKLRGDFFVNWLSWVYQRDSLIFHE